MRLVELEGCAPLKSRADHLTLLQPSLSPITWEMHKTGKRMDTEIHPGKARGGQSESWNVGKSSFCRIHHVGGTGEVRIGSLERVHFF